MFVANLVLPLHEQCDYNYQKVATVHVHWLMAFRTLTLVQKGPSITVRLGQLNGYAQGLSMYV